MTGPAVFGGLYDAAGATASFIGVSGAMLAGAGTSLALAPVTDAGATDSGTQRDA
jgi:hypothetical protein